MNFLRILVLQLYILAIGFILGAIILDCGLGLTTFAQCLAVNVLCAVAYFGCKTTTQVETTYPI